MSAVFKKNRNTSIFGDIYIRTNSAYEAIRKINEAHEDGEQFLKEMKPLMAKIVSIGEILIQRLQEIENEEETIDAVKTETFDRREKWIIRCAVERYYESLEKIKDLEMQLFS